MGVLKGLNEVIYVEYLEQCMIHSKYYEISAIIIYHHCDDSVYMMSNW